jgi:hypothetical protein
MYKTKVLFSEVQLFNMLVPSTYLAELRMRKKEILRATGKRPKSASYNYKWLIALSGK